MKNKKRIAIISGLTLAAALPSFAIFGLDFDPIQSAHAIQQIAQFETMITAARQNVQIIKQNVLALGHKQTYLHLLQSVNASALNAAIYDTAKLPMDSSVVGSASREQQADLSHIALSDTASQNTVSLLNQVASWQSSNRPAIDAWAGSVSSHDPNLNTQASLAGLTNTGLVNLYQQQQQALAVNAVIAQNLMLQNIKERNEEVAAINAEVQRGREFDALVIGDPGGALRNFKDR